MVTAAVSRRALSTKAHAVSVPNGVSQQGLPIGLQIVGRHFEEARVLQAAVAFETRVRFIAPPL